MSTEWITTNPIPPESPDWAALSRQFMELHRGSEIYRCGYVDDTVRDGSGLWMAADAIQGREPIWRKHGFRVGKLHRPADGVPLQLDAASSYASGSQEGPRTAGDCS